MDRKYVAIGILIAILVVVGLVLASPPSPSEKELANEMRDFLLIGNQEYSITMQGKANPEETHRVFGFSTRQLELRGSHQYQVNGTITQETRYETILRNGNLTMDIGDIGNETVSGVTEDDLGRTFDVSIGNRTEWRFVSHKDELRAILNERESVEGEPPGDITISLDTNESEVAEYFNRLQEAPTGRTFVEISPEDMQGYDAEFRFEYHDGRIDLTEDEAKLFVSAETDEWKIESEIGEGIQDE